MCLIWALTRFHIQHGENEKHSCRNGTGARSWRIGLNQGLILSVFDWDWLYNESLNLFELHLIFGMLQWRVTALAYGYVCFAACVRTLEEKQHDKPCSSVLMLICQCAVDRSKPAPIRPPHPKRQTQTTSPPPQLGQPSLNPFRSLSPERSESY